MNKKLLCLLLALVMLLSLAACGGGNAPPADPAQTPAGDTQTPPEGDGDAAPAEVTDYREMTRDDDEIYEMVFGDFYDAYMTAKDCQDLSQRYALMGIAEAKMLESAIMMPKQSYGGGYAMTRIAPYTNSPCLWGYDEYHYETIVAVEEIISAEDYAAMQALYGELSGTGTYLESVKAWLTEHGYTLKDTYNNSARFADDPKTWDILATSQTGDSEFICKTICGLLQYDVEGLPQPALAESWEVSEDGLTYTFHIRQGVKWVDSQGRELGEVTADDFVAGMQHMMDAQGGLQVLVQGTIAGAEAYIAQETDDFSTVGVKALDEYTLEYTLEQKTPYFLTMLNYGCFYPMNRAYYESQGGKFGAQYDNSAADYNYGKTPNNIAYCGAYLITNFTSKNSINYKMNPTFWNPDSVNIPNLNFIYDDGTDTLRPYNDFMAGTIDLTGLNPSALEQAKVDSAVDKDGNPVTATNDEGEEVPVSVFDYYHFQSRTDSTCFMGFFNVNRQAYALNTDATKVVSSQTEEDAARTHAAMLNQHFRMALLTGMDRGTFNAQRNGEELKFSNLLNSYTPGDFVKLEEDVTVDINGTPTTFPAGTNYGVIVQAQIDADGFPAKVYDPEGAGGAGASSGYDGWYNVEYAKSELAKAVEELAAMGLEITAENPIQIDYPYAGNAEVWLNCAQVIKKCWEEMSGGLIQVNLITCVDQPEWYACGYDPKTGAEMNYDFADMAGWGPDYGDPCSYLDTLLPNGDGFMAKSFGLYWA